jgi:hypothetical protein
MRCVLGDLLDHLGTIARLLPAERALPNHWSSDCSDSWNRLGDLYPPTQNSHSSGTAQELSNELRCVLHEGDDRLTTPGNLNREAADPQQPIPPASR